MVATLVALYEKVNNIKGATKLLDKAIQALPSDMTKNLLKKNAEYKTKLKDFKGAAEIYSKLLSYNPKDKEIIAHLVICLSHFDAKSTLEYGPQLPDTTLIKLSNEDLEGFVMPEIKQKQKIQKDTNTTEKLKKKKRKNKPPKDKSKPIDPERWIPLVKRSYYKGKRQKKNTGQKTIQGEVVTDKTVNISEKQSTTNQSTANIKPSKFNNKKGKNYGKKRR